MKTLNKSKLNEWMLVSYKCNPPFRATDDYFVPYFVLPTDDIVFLAGRAENDSRADEITGMFTDGHRLITGQVLSLDDHRATTVRTEYELGDMYPSYRAWLAQQDWKGPLNIQYDLVSSVKITEVAVLMCVSIEAEEELHE
jgi:hypothetical protein